MLKNLFTKKILSLSLIIFSSLSFSEVYNVFINKEHSKYLEEIPEFKDKYNINILNNSSTSSISIKTNTPDHTCNVIIEEQKRIKITNENNHCSYNIIVDGIETFTFNESDSIEIYFKSKRTSYLQNTSSGIHFFNNTFKNRFIGNTHCCSTPESYIESIGFETAKVNINSEILQEYKMTYKEKELSFYIDNIKVFSKENYSFNTDIDGNISGTMTIHANNSIFEISDLNIIIKEKIK